jgi:hypothetical protein
MNEIPILSIRYEELQGRLAHAQKAMKREMEDKIKNINAKILAPYYLEALKLLPTEEKAKHFGMTAENLATSEERLRYGGGIVMHDDLPTPIRYTILSFLPRANLKQLEKYTTLATTNHGSGLKINK